MRLSTASAVTLASSLGLVVSVSSADDGVSKATLRGSTGGTSSPEKEATAAGLSGLSVHGGEEPRALMGGMGMEMEEHPSFAPLSCNDPIDVPDASGCVPWSLQGYDSASMVIIPCGSCVNLDVSGTLDLPAGLNIEGKLRIPIDELDVDHAVEIVAPFVVVQGILEIRSSRDVSPDNEAVKFSMTGPGATDLDLASLVHANNTVACMHGCNAGKKPFVVAGGRLDVRALPDGCPSWTRIEDVVTRPAAVPPSGSYPAAPQPNGGCDASGVFLAEDFTGGAGGWNGNWNPGGFNVSNAESHSPGNAYFWVHGRSQTWQGPLVDIDVGCLVPNAMYVLRAKAKLVLTQDFNGMESNCQASGNNCLQGVYYYRRTSDDQPSWRGLGNEYTDYVGDGQWYDIVTAYTFTDEDVTPGNVHRLYFDGPEAGIDIMMDDITLELAGPEYYPPPNDVCSELIVNGGADNLIPHPIYTNADLTNLVYESEIDPETNMTNTYFSLKDRYGDWHSAEYKLPTSCITEGDVYTFSIRLRVHTASPVRPKILIFSRTDPDVDADNMWQVAKYCDTQTEADGWVACTSDYAFNAHQAGAGLIKIYIEVPEDIHAVVDYDDLSFAFKSGPAAGLVLPPSILPCWGVGSEVLVTSHTIQFDNDAVRTIASSSVDADSGKAVLELSEPVDYTVTTKEDEAANPTTVVATEVALLTRNVRLDSVDVPAGSKQGAHFIVYHTPAAQTVEGVEVRRFGQAGTLGRYPMHFHMCGNVEGSLLSKNVVRESFQRCYVVHGSHNVTLSDNIAYDSFGHCYFLEDGAEEDNAFLNNLGALTKNQPAADMITAQLETDNEASTFWMTNPQNTWEGNVAAGSEHSGFWFEMRDHVRGPSADMHPDKNPKVLPLKYFKHNVMHSNAEHGLKTYPGAGYEPEGAQAIFQGTKSFRNKGSGVFFHNSQNLVLEGGFYSDNRIQVDFDRAPTTRISNADVTGYSPLYQGVVEAGGGMWYHYHCPSSYPMVGVQLHTFWSGTDKARGSVVENVHFAHLGASTGCQGTRAINVDDESKGYFDIRTSLSGLVFDSETEKFEACTANSGGGIDFVAIRDLDSSVADQPGFIVSNSTRMTALLPDGQCSPMPDTCTLSCPGLCLRAKMFKVSGLTSDDLKLFVADTTDQSKTIQIHGYFENTFLDMEQMIPDTNEDTLVWRDRLFHVVVPETGGPYDARFELNGQDYWPRYVEEAIEDVPGNCGAGAFPTINVLEPAVEDNFCNDLVSNGDMEAGLDGWQNNGGGLAIHSQGVQGQALKSDIRTGSWNGPAQYLDTRCLVEGEEYQFEAKVKMALDSDGTDPGCDVHSDSGGCPKLVMVVQTDSDPEIRNWVTVAWGTKTGSWSTGQWNTMSGSFTIDSDMASAESAFIYFEGPPAGVDIIIDDVSMTPHVEEESVCSDTILNEAFTDSTNGWNGNWNPGGFELSTADSHTPGDSYFWVHGRSQTWQGPLRDVDISCMVPGVIYFLSAKVKYVLTAEFSGTEMNCETNGDNCLYGIYYRRDSADQPYWRGLGGNIPNPPGQWFEYAATYVFSEEDLTPGNSHRLYFEGPEAGIDIQIDDIYLRAAPTDLFPAAESLCDELMVNGGAEIAPPFTYPVETNAWKTFLTVQSETLNGENNNFFKLSHRNENWHSAQYHLPTSCITAGDTYTLSVKLRVHTSTTVTPKVLVKSESASSVEYKVLTYCLNISYTDGWVQCTADYTFTLHQGSADVVKVYLEVPEDINADIDYDDFSFVPKVWTT